jgi:hypothetical protein
VAVTLPEAAPLVPAQPAPVTALEPPAVLPPFAPAVTPSPLAVVAAPAPATASGEIGAATPARRSDSKTRLKKIVVPPRMTPSTAFDAVEADFFAREADLYKQEAVETFDDLDHGQPTEDGSRPLKRPAGGNKKKR